MNANLVRTRDCLHVHQADVAHHAKAQHLDEKQFEIAAAQEQKRQHDVMAHVHTFGQDAPAAAGIIQYEGSAATP